MTRLSPLASVSATREAMEAAGLATKKSLGQHFLIDDGVVARICELAQLSPEDDVLEIGPGIGTLTCALLQKAAHVTAIERDADLVPVLAKTCAPWADALDVLRRDALGVGPDDLPTAPSKLVANLPYAVAATLTLDAFERFPSIKSATVMVQAEVADRMAAKVGTKDYGAYTVKLSLWARPHGRFRVAPGCFFPPPRVDSAVVRLERIDARTGQGDAASDDELRRAAALMADAAFAARRKTIANSCKAYFASRGNAQAADAVPRILDAAGIDARRRGETLTTGEYLALGAAYLACRA